MRNAANHDVLSPASTGDRRRASRTVAVYKVVKIEQDGNGGLARCRNISNGGMMLDIAIPLALNDALTIELPPDLVLRGRVAWTNGNQCGVAFDRDIDCVQILSQSTPEGGAVRARSPRLRSHIPARIAADGAIIHTTIKNISQRGMLVTHSGQFRPGLQVQVLMNDGGKREALVQWAQENFAGLFLIDPYSVMELGDLQALERREA